MKTQLENARVIIDSDKLVHRDYDEYRARAAKIGVASLGQSKALTANLFEPESVVWQCANAIMVSLFDTSALSPGDMRDKVLAYQEEVMTIVAHQLREAMRLERLRIGLLLDGQGYSSAAALVNKY